MLPMQPVYLRIKRSFRCFNPNRSLDRMWFFSDIAIYSILYSFFLFGIFLLVARSLCPHNSLAPRQKSAQKKL